MSMMNEIDGDEVKSPQRPRRKAKNDQGLSVKITPLADRWQAPARPGRHVLAMSGPARKRKMKA